MLLYYKTAKASTEEGAMGERTVKGISSTDSPQCKHIGYTRSDKLSPDHLLCCLEHGHIDFTGYAFTKTNDPKVMGAALIYLVFSFLFFSFLFLILVDFANNIENLSFSLHFSLSHLLL